MSDTFLCKAPWTSIAFQPTGVAPCCTYKLNYVEQFKTDESLFKDIRNSFLSGKVPDGCSTCKDSVASGNRKSAPYLGFDKYETDFNELNIQEINLRSNNFCNLACRSCGPHFSSKWEEEFKGTVIVSKDKDVFDKIRTLDLTKLKLIISAGGEPTITQEHVQLLRSLLEIDYTTPVIRIATNLQVLNFKGTNLIDLWKQFPNLYLSVSVDGIGARAENIRSGSNWEVLLENLKVISANGINFSFMITVSALNIWFLEETLDFLASNFPKNFQNINMLHEPDILNICVIPEKYRGEIRSMLDRCLHKGYNVASIQRHLEHSDDSFLWDNFLIYNLMLDITRKENFCKSLPIFDDLVFDKTML